MGNVRAINNTDKKVNQIFLIDKEIQKGSVAKLYMTNGLPIYGMVKYLHISSYIRKPCLIYDFATNPIWISLHLRKISFSFLSVNPFAEYMDSNKFCWICKQLPLRLIAWISLLKSPLFCISVCLISRFQIQNELISDLMLTNRFSPKDLEYPFA